MRGGTRWALIAVAWTAPLVWLALDVADRPSDRVVVTGPAQVLGEGRWGDTVSVLATLGDSPLREGDQILEADGVPVASWFPADGDAFEVGDEITYLVRRPGAGLDRVLEVEVVLTTYPTAEAVLRSLDRVVAAAGLLVAGSFLVLRAENRPAANATLLSGAALTVSAATSVFAPQPLDLVVSGGLRPHVVATLAGGVALGLALLGVVAFAAASATRTVHAHAIGPPSAFARRGAWVLAVPVVAYAAWMLAFVSQPVPARTQAMLDLLVASLASAAAVALLLGLGYRHARARQGRVAIRVVALALAAGLTLRLVLDVVPTLTLGGPLVPWRVLSLLLVPIVVACWTLAVLGRRLDDLDAALRRSLLQVVLAAVVAGGFLATAGAVSAASGASVAALVTGGAVALLLLPAILVLRRVGSRLLYGDRAFPYRVVSQLRHLDPSTAPEDGLREVLTLLSRTLRLSYAAIEGAEHVKADDPLVIEVGQRRGEPTTVTLEVAGTTLGRLSLEVDPMREPFGPRDRRLLEEVGAEVGVLVQALSANRALQRSRERLVSAREEERRRLQRDLHDGLGPSLATRLMKLEVARELIATDPARAAGLVDELEDQTEADIAEVRRLVDGLRPPTLDQLGLVPALRQRADEHNHAAALGTAASVLTWTVSGDDVGTLPAAVEVAAYRIVVEAVTNALRHSRGRVCAVSLQRNADLLRIRVEDDGIGPGTLGGSGSGLGSTSMRERAEEVGGSCTTTAGAGGGTLVEARLPLSPGDRPPRDEAREES